MDSYIKNMSISPYIEPDRIMYAVEIDVKKEELNNYKIRPFSDEAILYEGYCVFPNDRAKAVEMVADLKRDAKGNPLVDSKTGKPIGIELRKRTEKEIAENPDKYIPSKDYIDYIDEKRKEFGYIRSDTKGAKLYNGLSNIAAGGKLEYNETVRSTKKNFFSVLKQIVSRFKTGNRLDENPTSKIDRILEERSYFKRKNPYADKKYALAVANFNKQGLTQYDLKEILPEFINSKDGAFLRDKRLQIDKEPIRPKGLHGIKHNDRVAILSLMIGNYEGILKENSTRERELLTTAAYYHDIGRIGDVGPHAKRSASKIGKIKLRTLDGKNFSDKDKKIVQLLAEGHEGKDEKISKLIEKYNIGQEDVEMVTNLLSILKDADALDRSRLTINTSIATVTDLEPEFLRLNSSKRLMDASYGLEDLTQKVDIEDLINYQNNKPREHYYKKSIEDIKVENYKAPLIEQERKEVSPEGKMEDKERED